MNLRSIIAIPIISAILLFLTVSPLTFTFWIILSFSFLFTEIVAVAIIDSNKGISKTAFTLAGLSLLLLFLAFFNSTMFRANDYANALTIKDINASDIIVSNPSKIRKVTKEMALVKANKILGRQIKGIELNTQYELGHASIIMYKGKQVWIFPLEYSGLFKWMSNDTIPGYVTISAIDPDAKPVFVNKPFKMSPSAYLFQNVDRITFFEHGMTNNSRHFEIDENGNPYWVFTKMKYKILGNLFEPESVVLVNAVTAETKEYNLKDVPKWVDKVIPSYLATEYIEYNAKYQKGFWNTQFANVNVLEPTVYNHHEVWLIENKLDGNLKWFTGLTSQNKKDNSLSSAIMVDTKSLVGYKIKNIQGITDESGATQSVSSKLGADGMRWKAVLPMPLYTNGLWYWTLSIVDKKSDIYQEAALVQGNDITKVYIGQDLPQAEDRIGGSSKTANKGDTPKMKMLRLIDDLSNELENLRAEVIKQP